MMFGKKLQSDSLNELQIKVKQLEEEVRDLSHQVQKQDGYIRSIRGAVNRIRLPKGEEEDLNSTDPTSYLRKL